VIVTPAAEQLDPDDAELQDFLRVRVVEVGPLQSLSWARASGVRQASALYVFSSGDAMERLSRLELHKIPHLAKRDRQAEAV